MKEEVILIDENDNEIGTMEKIEAHKKGLLHRAFSVCVFNTKGEMLLQKRASHKYHSGGLWSNTCCGHPRPKETILGAASRRLREEMGIGCELKEIGHFTYTMLDKGGLTEQEYLHILSGTKNANPTPNPEEAEGWKWVTLSDLKKDIQKNPTIYTYWFKKIVTEVLFPEKI